MRIGLLVASKIALPTLHMMVQQGIQLSIVFPQKQKEDLPELMHFANYYRIPWVQWSKQELSKNLASWQTYNQLDALLVMTFPYIIPSETLKEINIPFLNFHYAPLPIYAGAQPIFWMIKNGAKKGGVCVHELTSSIDAGPILCQIEYQMLPNETFGSYRTNIAAKGTELAANVLSSLQNGNWKQKLKKQDLSKVNYCSRPELKDVHIDWNQMKAIDIERLCRACNPWNKGAITTLNNEVVNLVEVTITSKIKHGGEPAGQLVVKNNSNQLMVSTIDQQYLRLHIIYLAAGFIRGENAHQWGLKSGMQFQSS